MSKTITEAVSLKSLRKELSEKNILLSLTEDIARIKAKKELMHLIKERFQKLFYFYHCTITVLAEDKKTFTIFFLDPESKLKGHKDYTELITRKNAVQDGVYNVVLQSQMPVLFNVGEVASYADLPFYIHILLESGLKEFLSVSLVYENEPIGVLTFFSDRLEGFAPDVFPVVQGIASQVSLAVKNTMANEEIQWRDKENDILLLLSNEIAAIRNKNDLTAVIGGVLKKYIEYNDSTITVYNKSKNTFGIFAYNLEGKRLNNPECSAYLNTEYPLSDDDFSHPDKPVVLDVETLANNGYSQVAFIHKTGIQEFAAIRLIDGDNFIGHFVLLSEKKNGFTKSGLNIMQRISYQISIAVTKILSLDELHNREKEKEILLTIGSELSSIRNKEDLLPILKRQLEHLSFYSDVTIAKVDSGNKTFSAFLINEESTRQNDINYPQMQSAHHSFPDGVFEVALQSKKPVVFDIEEIVRKGNAPPYVQFLYNNGSIDMAAISLRDRNREIGALFLFSDKKQSFTELQLSLVQGIGNLLGTAVANILANEEIKIRENEKSILLNVSNEIAAVRNKDDLFKVISCNFKELFSMQGFAIALVNEDKQTHSAFLFDLEENISTHPDFREILLQKFEIGDGLFDSVMNAQEPVTINVNELSVQPSTPSYALLWKKLGITLIVGVPLRVGESNLGCLFFHLDPDFANGLRNNLLKGVCAQISIALSNILANEEIKQKEEEKEILLRLSNDIASIRDKADLGRVIHDRLNELFFFDDIVICIINDDKNTHRAFIHLFENGKAQFNFDTVVTDKFEIADGIFDAVLKSNEPITFDLDELIETENVPLYIKFDYDNGMREMVSIALRKGKENFAALFVLLKQKHSLKPKHLKVLQGISYQLSIAIANILANEKIDRQLAEINRYREQLEDEKFYLQEEVGRGYTFSDIIGNGLEMQKVFHQLSQVSFTNSTVLLLGETGTGKELFARAIHNSSPRKDKLMVKVNCAALPANLIESELFGHERGSFTGAVERRIGKFELANNGTLFLDEIGEMTIDLQVKLLRAVQEKEIERVGGKTTIKTDVRIIAATNRDLQKEVEEGRFRRDLYYRLNVFPIVLPPLRERKEDIPVLASHFIGKYAKNTGKKITDISGKVMKELQAYSWPGNVRELEHLIERSILTTGGNMIKEIHLPINKREALKNAAATDYLKTHEENERDYIIDVLNNCKGKIFGTGGAAEILSLNVSTLNSKIKKLGIKKEKSFYKKNDASS
jgi:formate hydrogenlyase transcriptional activator